MTGWHERPMYAWDTETTGILVESARIVSAAVVRVAPGEATQHCDWLIDPGVPIPEEATAIHGITTEHARTAGSPAAQSVAEIADALSAAWAEGAPVIGYNVTFDFTILDRELRRHHGRGLDIAGPVIDPLVLDRHIDRQRYAGRQLTPNCEHYRVKLDLAHDARADAIAAARIGWRLGSAYPQLAALPLAELMALQADAHEQWAIRLTDYRRSIGQADAVDGTWPMLPVPAVAVGGVR